MKMFYLRDRDTDGRVILKFGVRIWAGLGLGWNPISGTEQWEKWTFKFHNMICGGEMNVYLERWCRWMLVHFFPQKPVLDSRCRYDIWTYGHNWDTFMLRCSGLWCHNVVVGYQRFRGPCHPHLQTTTTLNSVRTQKTLTQIFTAMRTSQLTSIRLNFIFVSLK